MVVVGWKKDNHEILILIFYRTIVLQLKYLEYLNSSNNLVKIVKQYVPAQ